MRLKEYLTEDSDKINDFLAKFGLGPNYKSQSPMKHECPECKQKEAVYVEEHPDTDMNVIALKCPCGYSNDSITEDRAAWLTMSKPEREKLRKTCKHDWRHKGTYLQGVFYECSKCGVEGKEYKTDHGNYKIKRVRK